MTAPAGAEVGLYVDLVARVRVGDVIRTQTGRRYAVVSVRVQERGALAGRQHLRAIVLGVDEPVPAIGENPRIHDIVWYTRSKGRP